MMSPDEPTLEDVLCLGDGVGGAELRGTLLGLQPPEHALTAVSIPEPILCAGCGQQVCERFFLLAAGRAWHNGCLRCCQCQCELQTQPSLYCRDGAIYCLLDYCRMFGGGQCARCLQPIPASTLVMKSGQLTFHLHCFTCQECDVRLTTGNLYSLQGHNLYCHAHYHAEGAEPEEPHPAPGESDAAPAQQASCDAEESIGSSSPEDGGPEPRRARGRNKRIRTCFRSEQLRALEAYFAQKHNPDGKDWTCLSHKTGLPKRVLQVWFQNARAKLRRSLTSDSPPCRPLDPAAPAGGGGAVAEAAGQSQPFPVSTIDQMQLSLLTAPLSPPPPPPQQHQHHQPSPLRLDYTSHGAPGCSSSQEAPRGAGAGAEEQPGGSYPTKYY